MIIIVIITQVWMNNHRPRKNNMNYVPHPYLKDNKHFLPSRDLSKVKLELFRLITISW